MAEADVSKREIFPYHDGTRERLGDPFVIVRKLRHNKYGDLTALESLAKSEDSPEPETSQFFEAVREAFGLTAWEDDTRTGLTDYETIEVFNSFAEWLEGLKKNGSPGPTSSPITDSESSQSPEAPNESMSEPSASGLARSE